MVHVNLPDPDFHRNVRDIREYFVNGSGLLLTRTESDDGIRTVRFGSDVGGMMNMTEPMVLDD